MCNFAWDINAMAELNKKKVLMLCLGNICRSPLAEGIFKAHVEKSEYSGLVEVDSAGTGSWHVGDKPNASSIQVAANNGVNISGQRARQLIKLDLDKFDLILGMDRNNLEDLNRLGHGRMSYNAQTDYFMNYAGVSGIDVPDPWGQSIDAFESVYEMIDSASPAILNRLMKS